MDVIVTILEHDIVEDSESFLGLLTNPLGESSIIDPASATVTILDSNNSKSFIYRLVVLHLLGDMFHPRIMCVLGGMPTSMSLGYYAFITGRAH